MNVKIKMENGKEYSFVEVGYVYMDGSVFYARKSDGTDCQYRIMEIEDINIEDPAFQERGKV